MPLWSFMAKPAEEIFAAALELTNRAAPRCWIVNARVTQAPSTPTQVGEAVWYAQRTVKFAPAQAEAWCARAEALLRVGRSLEAFEDIIASTTPIVG